jgi:DNA-directed RNA polymerase specialized sigma24 family protein
MRINYKEKRTKEQWATHYELKEFGKLQKEQLELLNMEVETYEDKELVKELSEKWEEISQKELYIKYNKILKILSNDPYYNVFYDKYILGLNVDDISEKYKINKSTVHYNINRLLRYSYILVGGEE